MPPAVKGRKKSDRSILWPVLLKSLVANLSRLVLILVLVLGGLGDAGGASFGVSGVEKTEVKSSEGVRQVRAWETLFDFPTLRKIPLNLEAVSNFRSAFPNKIAELKDAVTASTNKDRFFAFLKRTNKIGFGPDESLYATDRARNVLVGNSYVPNPTRRLSSELHVTPSGKVKLDASSGDALNGQYMYVVDELDNVVIGQRASGPPFNGYAPHPSLIGGENPMVQAAGIIEFRGGKIYKVDNASGHFKPSASSLTTSQSTIEASFGQSSFATNFQGYVPIIP